MVDFNKKKKLTITKTQAGGQAKKELPKPNIKPGKRPQGQPTEIKDHMKTPFYTFTDPGESVEGFIVDGYKGRFGDVIVLQVNPEETLKLGLSVQLKMKLEKVQQGDYIIITYNGKVPTPGGQTMKAFTVMHIPTNANDDEDNPQQANF